MIMNGQLLSYKVFQKQVISFYIVLYEWNN
jgi:hypothetical protein